MPFQFPRQGELPNYSLPLAAEVYYRDAAGWHDYLLVMAHSHRARFIAIEVKVATKHHRTGWHLRKAEPPVRIGCGVILHVHAEGSLRFHTRSGTEGDFLSCGRLSRDRQCAFDRSPPLENDRTSPKFAKGNESRTQVMGDQHALGSRLR